MVEVIMMYNKKFVAAIKVGGKILREVGDVVLIPFGAEYSILLKNLNSVRALVKVSIDGVDVSPDGLVVNPNSEIDLERFIRENNLNSGNRFKFIERTTEIEDGPRGIKSGDGIVRIGFQFEVQADPVYVDHHIYHRDIHHWPSWNPYYYRPYMRGVIGSNTNGVNAVASSASFGSSLSKGISDVGITVPGSRSDQKFETVSGFSVEDSEHVIVFNLRGETSTGKAVNTPVTVKTKPVCITCGKTNKATSKFCSSCGTALELI
jgi:hypothetical protein